MSRSSLVECLGEARGSLDGSPAEVRSVIEQLVAPSAAVRLEALQAAGELLTDDAARPLLLALATSPRYPQASALLVRLSAALSRVDTPPRAHASEAARSLVGSLAQHAPSLLRVARTSRDPESARAAARVLGHLPGRDEELEPLLLALLSGAADAVERAPLLYLFVRIQLALGRSLHPRVARARLADPDDPERVAVCLALEDAGAPDAESTRLLAGLRGRASTSRRLPDPRVWGQSL